MSLNFEIIPRAKTVSNRSIEIPIGQSIDPPVPADRLGRRSRAARPAGLGRTGTNSAGSTEQMGNKLGSIYQRACAKRVQPANTPSVAASGPVLRHPPPSIRQPAADERSTSNPLFPLREIRQHGERPTASQRPLARTPGIHLSSIRRHEAILANQSPSRRRTWADRSTGAGPRTYTH